MKTSSLAECPGWLYDDDRRAPRARRPGRSAPAGRRAGCRAGTRRHPDGRRRCSGTSTSRPSTKESAAASSQSAVGRRTDSADARAAAATMIRDGRHVRTTASCAARPPSRVGRRPRRALDRRSAISTSNAYRRARDQSRFTRLNVPAAARGSPPTEVGDADQSAGRTRGRAFATMTAAPLRS